MICHPLYHPCMKSKAIAVGLVACAALFGWLSPVASAAGWLTAPSYYTHEPSTGQRVTQYAQVGPFYYYFRPDYMKSGYRHTRSTIQLGNSADNLHIVEEWGRPVRPYEEWRFPYRPFSVPYNAWGPQVNVMGFPGAFGNFGPGGNGGGYPGGGMPGGMYPGGGGFPGVFPGQPNVPSQVIDGFYPTYDRNDRSDYYRPYTNGGYHNHHGPNGPGPGPGPNNPGPNPNGP